MQHEARQRKPWRGFSQLLRTNQMFVCIMSELVVSTGSQSGVVEPVEALT